ncbi:MAG TPA: hypothetical protein VJP02_22835 [Candidatus Sulfotelmatobacter sp.]|nr:hypothetical protein [Candidatus Sulfotelmatobacter sp.]
MNDARNEKLKRSEIFCAMCSELEGRPIYHGWRKSADGKEYKPTAESDNES